MPIVNTDEMLTCGQAAVILKLSEDTVRKHCQRRRIVGTKVGRDWIIHKNEVARYRKERRTPGRPPKADK